MRPLHLWLLLGAGWVLPSQAADVEYWLDRLAGAQQLSFVGSFAYERDGAFSTHRLWRQVEPDGHVRERLQQLDGEGLEIVRENGQLLCSSHGQPLQAAGASASAPIGVAQHLQVARLTEGYTLRLQGATRVAGRDAVVLSVSPRDQHRYGLELHLDSATALPLKSLLLNEKGQLLERLQFVQFEPQGETPMARQALVPGTDCRPAETSALQSSAASGGWHAAWLPPGFALDGAIAESSLTWLRYSDGLAHFSVFVEPLRGAVADDVRSQFGPTAAVSRRMKVEQGDVMVTVVGEVPPGTAERVALSVRDDGVAVAP
ncbi:MAG: MucB/RseB C-terminal domain-containing protein [Pseudomonas sp.]|uniref:MucB/RseB C-terminal domain-containing protein n=1 Tax=Pseudomonas sp. TaxID=306 RepID=UPI00339B1FFA